MSGRKLSKEYIKKWKNESQQMSGEKKLTRKYRKKNTNANKQIALLGGAFDPPTLGHIAIARLVLDNLNISQVWLAPCRKHMFNKEMSSVEHRLTMLRYAIGNDCRIKICDYEIKNELHGETYYFLISLLNSVLAQTNDFSYIIGMDNANNFDKWFNFEKLERLVRFIVVPRVGEEPRFNDWYLKSPHMFLRSDKPLPDTASSIVRKELFSGNHSNYLNMLDSSVVEYIDREKLYITQE